MATLWSPRSAMILVVISVSITPGATATAIRHMCQGCLRHEHRAHDVGFEDWPDEISIHRAQGPVGADSRTIDQHFNGAEPFRSTGRQSHDIIRTRNVCLHGKASITPSQRANQCFRRDLVGTVADNHAISIGGKTARNGSPYAARSTGHDGDLAFGFMNAVHQPCPMLSGRG